MTGLRFTKVLRDLWAARVRVAMMVGALCVSLIAIGTMLTAKAILAREMTANYQSTHPAAATLDILGVVSPHALALARSVPGVADAAARRSIVAKVRFKSGAWQPMLLFVVQTDDPLRVSSFAIERGRWPAPRGTLLLERSTLAYFKLNVGDAVRVRIADGRDATLAVSGSVHDPALAPSNQEAVAYGYVTPATLSVVGEDVPMDRLKITVTDARSADAIAQTIERVLQRNGIRTEEIDVPPPMHPHQNIVNVLTSMFVAFGAASLVLSAVLTATILGSLLAQHLRQIGIMKAIGASTPQVLRLYVCMVLLIAAIATALALYPSLRFGAALASGIGTMLNIDVRSVGAPWWVYAVLVAAGIGLPLVVAFVPLIRGTHVSIRDAIDDRSAGELLGAVTLVARLTSIGGAARIVALSLRNAVRRPGRLALSTFLLAIAGAMIVAAASNAGSWSAMISRSVANHRYDERLDLTRRAPCDRIAAAARSVAGVASVDCGASAPAALGDADLAPIFRTYPDGGHGSLTLAAVNPKTQLMTLPVVSGRWLNVNDAGAVVFSNMAMPLLPSGTGVGDDIGLSVGGRYARWKIAGFVSDVGVPGTAYVTPAGFARVADPGTTIVRILMRGATQEERARIAARLVDALRSSGIRIKSATPTTRMQVVLDGHVMVLVDTLLALAFVTAIVGILGLASAMSTSVLERTREFGVMRSIGATSSIVFGIVLVEGLAIAALSLVPAALLSIPLAAFLDAFLGRLAFHVPLPFTLSIPAFLIWSVLALAGAAVATVGAASGSSMLSIRESLAHS